MNPRRIRPHLRGSLRIDPAPRWNRTSDALLVPHWTGDDTRQLFIIQNIESDK